MLWLIFLCRNLQKKARLASHNAFVEEMPRVKPSVRKKDITFSSLFPFYFSEKIILQCHLPSPSSYWWIRTRVKGEREKKLCLRDKAGSRRRLSLKGEYGLEKVYPNQKFQNCIVLTSHSFELMHTLSKRARRINYDWLCNWRHVVTQYLPRKIGLRRIVLAVNVVLSMTLFIRRQILV